MEFRRLHTFTLEQLTSLWNEGFQDYFVSLNFTLDMFVMRTANEGLSLSHSFAIMDGERPVGFVMNGFRQDAGRTIAWNGGTALIPEYRGKGIGKQLIEEAIRIYRAENADIALLEAIKENAPAIALYRGCGYEIIDGLSFYQLEGQLEENAFGADDASGRYAFTVGNPQDVRRFAFHEELQPWQSQWQSLQNGGLAMIAHDETGDAAGYALFKRVMDEQGEHQSTILYQCALKHTSADGRMLARALLGKVFASAKPVVNRTGNFPQSQRDIVEALEQAGFTTTMEQVHMKLVIR